MHTKPLLLLTTLALLAGSCGGTAAEPTTSTAALSSLPTVESDLPATDASLPTSTITTTTGTPDATTSTTRVEGEPIEFGPRAGDVLAVMGVRHDDVLNLRAGPSPRQEIVGTIGPVYDGLVALGETWQLPAGLWVKVAYEGLTGWVNLRFVAYAGATDDATAAVVTSLGTYPVAPSMEDLGLIVAESLATSSEPGSMLVMSVAPTPGDRSEVTYDIIGVGDDAAAGVRAHVFAIETEGGFTLDTVEAMQLCARGVTPEGLCI